MVTILMRKIRASICSGVSILLACVLSGCGGGSTGGGNPAPHSLVIDTFAGTGVAGYSGDGGPAQSAELDSPDGVSIDASGNVYIADVSFCLIRRVDSSGKITTIAGNTSCGYSGDGGPATAAALFKASRAVADRAGNVYIADFYNNRIRKLSNPNAVAVDSGGNLYIADTWNQRIRKIDSSGTINTIAGTGFAGVLGDGGPATSSQVNELEGIAVDSSGDVYIANYGNSEIRQIDTSGIMHTVAGTRSFGYSGDGGPATAAALNFPTGVAVDAAGNVYVADNQNNRVRKIDTSGTITTIAGTGTSGFSGDGGSPTSAELSFPSDVGVDSLGRVYIADNNNQRIRVIH